MRYFLVGFMGSGKTTLGIQLAARLGLPFVDLDALIQAREGATVAQIFAEVGESGFRYVERLHLFTMLKRRNVVVATGGGTPTFLDNMDWMSHFGVTVYLQTSPEILFQRLINHNGHRPLLARFQQDELLPFVQEMLLERQQFYESAHLVLPQIEPKNEFLNQVELAVRRFRKKKMTSKTHQTSKSHPND